MFEPRRRTVYLAITKIEMRICLDRLDDRPSDDMRKRRLTAALRGQMLVDDAAVLLEDLDRNVAKARGGRDRQAELHVLDDLFGCSGERFGLGVGRKWSRDLLCNFRGLRRRLGHTPYGSCFCLCVDRWGSAVEKLAEICLP